MLTLISVPGTAHLRSLSPFSYKAEALLALSKHSYQIEYVTDFSSLPHGKVPVLKDGEHIIPDSALIQAHLEQHYGLNLDADLSDSERAVALAFRLMVENHLYWAGVYGRWLDTAGEDFMLGTMFAAVPAEARTQVFETMREGVRQQLHMHGLGRHHQEDIYAFAIADLDAIAAYLGDKPFLLGDKIHSVDAAVVGVLANLFANDFDTALNRHVQGLAVLKEYVARFEQAAFGA